MKLALIMITCVSLLFSCAKTESVQIEPQSYSHSALELDLLAEINHYRDSIGVGVVTIEEHASFLSSQHNEYMIDANAISHDYFPDRVYSITNLFHCIRVGEIVAYNYQTNRSVLKAWNNSPCHDTIIRSEFTRIGISIREANLHRKFYTVIFFD
jgi:uncharacterized protein YkwD